MKNYAINILISIDQFFNTLLGGNPDETISLRTSHARAEGKLWGCVLCRLFDLFKPGHCDTVST
jgi:hypothetical protein